MASKATVSLTFLLALNLVFSSFVYAEDDNKCPIDTLKLGVCAKLLGGVVDIEIGKTSCCPLISKLVDLDAAVCLCTALKANVLGLRLNIPVDLSLILNGCNKKIAKGFKC
ncbi:lipid transfer protein EARLI 1-like [Cucumis melo var. makuwa]|uniref:Lipid transfer protein EARLI 1-like n=1 Tax=Cucumis melo var. makuwa TaxID=1194695 RepID=A0A5A7T8X5_CUCMM|nr:lipid transfer protein EARLI 1-like [Cucumis melo var. makuwa]TYK02481.1 lipid transfer protein EARLI 1-like [Cucumis melo var. makuwa]